MTARHFLQLINKLELPFSSAVCVEILSREDTNIADNIERNISFVQFAEALIALIMHHKDMEIAEEADKEAEFITDSNASSPNNDEPKDKQSSTELKFDDDNIKLSITSIKSGSLLQTISELSDQPKQDPSHSSIDEVSNIRLEVLQYIQGMLLRNMITCKFQEFNFVFKI